MSEQKEWFCHERVSQWFFAWATTGKLTHNR
jgi:hypothetical protein